MKSITILLILSYIAYKLCYLLDAIGSTIQFFLSFIILIEVLIFIQRVYYVLIGRKLDERHADWEEEHAVWWNSLSPQEKAEHNKKIEIQNKEIERQNKINREREREQARRNEKRRKEEEEKNQARLMSQYYDDFWN